MAKSEKRKTKAQWAHEEIRRMILSHEFSLNSAWTLRSLAKKLGISMIPISEAIRKLEQEGLLETRPQSGIRLRYLSEQDRLEMGVVREALEVQAARLLALNPKPAGFYKLRKLAVKLQKCLDHKEIKEAAFIDFDFHSKIVKLAGCKLLSEKYDQVATRCMVISGKWGDWKDRKSSNPENHLYVINKIASGDPNKAERAVRRHIRAELNF